VENNLNLFLILPGNSIKENILGGFLKKNVVLKFSQIRAVIHLRKVLSNSLKSLAVKEVNKLINSKG
jgi:hypothetical protein